MSHGSSKKRWVYLYNLLLMAEMFEEVFITRSLRGPADQLPERSSKYTKKYLQHGILGFRQADTTAHSSIFIHQRKYD